MNPRRATAAGHLRRRAIAMACALAAAAVIAPAAVQAGATTDGSVGAVQTLSGSFTIPQSLGTVRGANLFHSFGRFSILAGESATFTTVDAGLKNVIARVTGGEASLLQGPLTLSATGGAKPDFFFVNPSGITIAQGASFDVPGALHLSTAAQLRFADGTTWSTGSSAPSTLSIAAPEAFGFLGSASAPISVSNATLSAGTGRALTLGAGAITLTDADLAASNDNGSAGSVTLRTNGDLRVNSSRIIVSGASGAGDIELRAGGALALTGSEVFAGGGTGAIRLSGRSAALDATTVQMVMPQAGSVPGVIAVATEGALTMANGAELSTVTFAANALPQAITIDSASLRMTGASIVASTALLGGDAGGLRVNTPGEMRLEGGSRILSSTGGAGRAGPVVVRAGQLRVIGVDHLRGDDIQSFYAGSGIFSQSEGTASGASGSIDVQVAGSIELTRQSLISVASAWQGDAGELSLKAASLLLDGEGLPGPKGLSSAALRRAINAGRIDVQLSGELIIRGGASIASETASATGRGGDIRVRAETITIDGQGSLGGRARSGIFAGALAESSGRVGAVDVVANGRVSLHHGAAIGIANESLAEPAPGSEPSLLQLRGAQLMLDDAEITASSVGRTAASGIRLGAEGAAALTGTVVRTSAVDGNGGPITISAAAPLWLRDSTITTSVSGATNGNGGDIRIEAPALVMQAGAVQANTTAPLARGGTVTLAVAALVPDGSHAFIGGDRIRNALSGAPGSNVIQAAAPDGVAGTLNIGVPHLDLSGQLAGVNAVWIDFGALVADACLRNERSGFGIAGRGALPPTAAQVLRFAP